MVSEQSELVTIEILVELAYSKDYHKRLSFNLSITLFLMVQVFLHHQA